VPDVDAAADVAAAAAAAAAADVPTAGELVVDGVADGLAVDPVTVSRDDDVKDGRESRAE